MKYLNKFNESSNPKYKTDEGLTSGEKESKHSLIGNAAQEYSAISVVCPHCGVDQDTNPHDIFGGDEFTQWDCESCGEPMECSQAVVYVSRKPMGYKKKITFTTLSKEDKEKMMKDAITMSEESWMKKYSVGDHGDYLRMAKSNWGLDESKVTSMGVEDVDMDEYIQPVLNIKTDDGRTYFVNLKTWNDFDDED